MQASRSAGFTVVEVLVTLIIAALFIAAISQLHIVQSRVSSSLRAFDIADSLAYNNLRTFAYGRAPSWFECVYSGGSPQTMQLLHSTDPVEGLPSPVVQQVVASAPYGCGGGGANSGYPIKVLSKVTYGPEGKEIVHATYSTY